MSRSAERPHDALGADLYDVGQQFTEMGEATLAAALDAMRADPRLAPSPDAPPITEAAVAARTDDELTAWALTHIALASDELAAVLTAAGLPAAYTATVADVGRYWAVPGSMPLGRRLLLAGALASRHPAAAPLAHALAARTQAALERYGDEAGAWIAAQVAPRQVPRASQAMVVAFTAPTSKVNLALQTGTPAEARAALVRAAEAAVRAASRTP
jgi:hypothetical protein